MSDGLKCKYFVLSPASSSDRHAMASRKAILTYAKAIEDTYPQWAKDLRDWMQQLEWTDKREEV